MTFDDGKELSRSQGQSGRHPAIARFSACFRQSSREAAANVRAADAQPCRLFIPVVKARGNRLV
jgi:hypothetical protein